MRDFSELWQNDELSDIVLLLKTRPPPSEEAAEAEAEAAEQSAAGETASPSAAAAAAAAGGPVAGGEEERPHKRQRVQQEGAEDLVLARIPAHRIILSQSPYFKAQIQRWQEQQQQVDGGDGGSSSVSTPTTVSLMLESETKQAAAMAMVAAMYGPQAAAGMPLTDVQLVHKVILADMLQVGAADDADSVAHQAVQELCAAVQEAGEAGMSEELQEQLQQLSSWPVCLLAAFARLTQHTRLVVLGGMWVAAAGLSHDAPLAEVPSEDIVLYTAKLYALNMRFYARYDAEQKSQLQSAATQLLGLLVRCPHLSSVQILLPLTHSNPERHMLHPFLEHIKALAMLRQLQPDAGYSAAVLRHVLKGAPPSWFLGPRTHTRIVDAVSLEWEVPIAKIREVLTAAARPDASARDVRLTSRRRVPLDGVPFVLSLCGRKEASGTSLVFLIKPDASVPITTKFEWELSCPDIDLLWNSDETVVFAHSRTHGHYSWSFFKSDVNGWDEAGWIRAGLPLDVLRLRLEVYRVDDA